jgi:outer membrane protein assembly factor BamB
MLRVRVGVLAVGLVLAEIGGLLPAAERSAGWPQLLGPQRDGISRESGWNVDWKAKKPQVVWKVPLGSAFSSLAISGDRLWTTGKKGERDFIYCLEARTGKEVWAFDAAASYIDKQRHGPGPRATPTLHGDKLYCLLPMGELICLSAADGKKLWQADTFKQTGARNREGETVYYWGVSPSPLVEGDLVIVQPGGTKDNSVAAFHKDTGKLVWTAGSDLIGYASPIVITVAGRRQLVCPTGDSVLGLEPTTGRVLWRYSFGNRFQATAATPVWADNLLFVSAAYGTGCATLELVQEGQNWSVREKWRKKDLQSLFATPIVLKGHIYGCHGDLGAIFLKCLELKTGRVVWEERQPGRFSLVAADDHLFCLGERGSLRLVEANPQRYVLKGELPNLMSFRAWAGPALTDGKMYLRDQQQVLCLDLRR